jgi:hypothetical protein
MQAVGRQEPDRHAADQPRIKVSTLDLAQQPLSLGSDVRLDRRGRIGHRERHPITNW